MFWKAQDSGRAQETPFFRLRAGGEASRSVPAGWLLWARRHLAVLTEGGRRSRIPCSGQGAGSPQCLSSPGGQTEPLSSPCATAVVPTSPSSTASANTFSKVASRLQEPQPPPGRSRRRLPRCSIIQEEPNGTSYSIFDVPLAGYDPLVSISLFVADRSRTNARSAGQAHGARTSARFSLSCSLRATPRPPPAPPALLCFAAIVVAESSHLDQVTFPSPGPGLGSISRLF